MLSRVGAAARSLLNPLLQTRSISSSGVLRSSGGVFVHRDTPDNNASTSFDWSSANIQKIETILAKYPSHYKRAGTIPLLHLAQRQNGGWLSLSAMNKVADTLGVARSTRKFVGKHVVQVCTTTPCELCGSGPVLDAIKQHLDVDVGGTSADKQFTLMEVECLGACVNAPMMQINDDFYEDLTPETAVDVLKKLKEGKSVKAGPQGPKARNTCEPSHARTSLKSPAYGPMASNLDRVDPPKPAEAPKSPAPTPAPTPEKK